MINIPPSMPHIPPDIYEHLYGSSQSPPRSLFLVPLETFLPAFPLCFRDFVEQHYVSLKKANPDFPFLIRECSGVPARLWARYDLGREQSVSVDNMSAEQVAGALKTLVQSKP
uniref:NADH dehydrogenase [ubiquinone] 1 alpha subcomplex subunit 2 n=1 Tax=Oryzias melastigma TaxID=30732 RepID=A0A3B3DAU6_ORYME